IRELSLILRRLEMHVSITPEIVTHIFGVPVTNTLIASLLTTVVLVVIVYFATRKVNEIPKGLQNLFEMIIESLFKMIDDVTGDRKQTYQFFPLVATIFIFIIVSNWLGLFPGFGSIGFYETIKGVHGEEHAVFVSFFRSANSDLNTTLALAMISVMAAQIFGILALGVFKYGKKFINFSSPITFFVGILELIGELAKMISFSFRLFGNVFAGEVLLVVIMTLAPFVAPLPFFGLELFVGFIQALVFAMLTLVFLKVAVTAHEEH
ncbi:MAG: F0F1 ATP synthase subunit A, partial [Candidatus Pacebacteria bacterium]|nr:F0F1 ATP synthase subunit A [Candidatus Paceibacterota bacterium]